MLCNACILNLRIVTFFGSKKESRNHTAIAICGKNNEATWCSIRSCINQYKVTIKIYCKESKM